MVNQEILGGLRLILNKGSSLEKAMTSFYNAGYKQEEIEEAARVLHKELRTPLVPAEKIINENEIKYLPANKKISTSVQKVSDYNLEKPKKKMKKVFKWVLVALIVMVVLFVGLLIAFILST